MKQYLFRRDGSLIYTEKEWWEKFGCSVFIYYFCKTKGLTRIDEKIRVGSP